MASQVLFNFLVPKKYNLKSVIVKYFCLLIFSLISTYNVKSQIKFISKGELFYEFKIGQFTLMDSQNEGEEESFWTEEMKKVKSKVISEEFVLDFSDHQSVFRMINENSDNKYWMNYYKPSESDFIYKDLANQVFIQRKNIFEKEYTIKDSLIHYDWKITGEVRNIAGFECKKAITRICDSVVVVAFYTDEILSPSGPLNFQGLPGMILGIAVPRLALTIFASRLELVEPRIQENGLIGKVKLVTKSQVNKDLDKAMKDWGKSGKFIQWFNNL